MRERNAAIRRFRPFVAIGPLVALAAFGPMVPAPLAAQAVATPRGDEATVFHGVAVPDPYRWLEELDEPRVDDWVRARDSLTRRTVAATPGYDAVRERLDELDGYAQIGEFVRRGDLWFYLEDKPGGEQPVLYAEPVDGRPRRVLLDPTSVGAPGQVAIADYSPSPSGRLIAVALVNGPSRYFDWRFVDSATGEVLSDRLAGAKIPVANQAARNPWSADERSFFYIRFQDADRGDESVPPSQPGVFVHRIGSPQAEDSLLHERPDRPDVRFDAIVGDGGGFLLIHEYEGHPAGDSVFVLDLDASGAPGVSAPRPLLGGRDATYTFLGNEGDRLLFSTTDGAEKGRVISVERRRPEPEAWIEVVPEAEAALQQAHLFGGRLLLVYLERGRNVAEVRRLDGTLAHRLELPDGLIWGFTLRYWPGVTGDRERPEAFIRSLGPTSVGSIYRLDLLSGELSLARRSGTPFAFDEITSRQVTYRSEDGTEVPMFLAHRKDVTPDGDRPVLLWVYGAYGWTAQPFLNPMYAHWLERGGVFAMPNVRGGGIYGDAWRRAGSRAEKPNTVRDVIGAAEWLVAAGWTRPERLTVLGNSAGATAAAGAFVLHPELFGATVLEVPLTDLIRAPLFQGGTGWTGTFGSPDDEAEFRALLSYSPYQNVDPGRCYPPVFIAAGDEDVTAVPLHAYKLTAALEHAAAACDSGAGPHVLLRVDWGTDHGANKPQSNRLAEWAAELTFLFDALEMGPPAPAQNLRAPVGQAVAYFEAYERADALWQQGRLTDVMPLLEELVSTYPDDPLIRYRAARGRELQGDVSGAIQGYRNTLALGFASRALISVRIARLFAASARLDSAVAWLRLALDSRYGDRPDLANDEAFEETLTPRERRQVAGLLPDRDFTRDEGWCHDIDFLVSEARRMHVAPHRPAFSPAFETAAADLRARVPHLTNDQMLVELSRLITMLGDGHTAIYAPADESPLEFVSGSLPVLFYLFDDGLHIVDGVGDARRWIGAKVLRFGTLPAEEVLARLDEYVHHDNPQTHKWLGVHFALRRRIVLYQVMGATDHPNQVTLELQERHGRVSRVTFRGDDSEFPRRLRPQPEETEAPLWLRDIDRNYWTAGLPEIDALYWQFNRVRDLPDGPSIAQFADSLRSQLETTQAKYLIVDVRHNNGGNTNLIRPLLRLMTWWEQDQPGRRIFVIMGRNTFSAAQNFISRVEQWTDAVFVGEPSSSRPNFTGEETALVLPYSRIRGSISNRHWQNAGPDDDRPWIAPQIPITLSSGDYFANRDPAMEAIAAIIERESARQAP